MFGRIMASETKQIKCKKANCQRKGFWIETGADGKPLFCFRTRHDGENHIQKLTLDEIESSLKEAH